MKVNRNDFSNAMPVLKPADIAPATVAILDCNGVEEREFDNGKRLQLTFEQFPEHVYYLNVTGIDQLTEQLGDDTSDWETKIPLVVVKANNPTTGKMQDVLHVADAGDWDDLLAGKRPGARKVRATGKARGKAKAKARR